MLFSAVVLPVFLALADIVYRKANLEHAAASEVNLQQNALLIVMLTMPLIAMNVPELTIGWVHPISVLLGHFAARGS